ncbi:MAG: hypothetical protein ACI4JW_04545 [Oscillospiraceae bacterium]
MAEQENFTSMQEDAIRRVREMQRRSRSYVEPPSDEPPETQRIPSENEPVGAAGKPPPKPLFNIGGLKIDEEKAMIALLIYILYKNNADMKLLLALAYLLI